VKAKENLLNLNCYKNNKLMININFLDIVKAGMDKRRDYEIVLL